jgi:tRNA dimethylallyltransferase
MDLARHLGGEIVSCDSTAVYRGLDIGTDKPSPDERRAVPHHLIDVADPSETYSAARYAREAGAAIHAIVGRGRVPILVGGTGFYYRALVRGLFPGPGRDDALRARLERVAAARGVEYLHRWLSRVDPSSGRRILPRDRTRLVRALEVYLLTGRPLTDHFDQTASSIEGFMVRPVGVVLPRPEIAVRVARRVDRQFTRGVVAEVEALLAAGISETAHALSGLVYRQVIELVKGVRDDAATRELIVRENMRYAKRQMAWFRQDAEVRWLSGAGESPELQAEARAVAEGYLAEGVR